MTGIEASDPAVERGRNLLSGRRIAEQIYYISDRRTCAAILHAAQRRTADSDGNLMQNV